MRRLALLCVTISCFIRMAAFGATETTGWQSPFEAKVFPDGKWLAVSDRTAGMLLVVDPLDGKVVRETSGVNQPTGVVWGPDGGRVFISEYATGTVADLDAVKGQLIRRISVGHGPIGLVVAPKKNLLIVCNSNGNDISLVDIASAKEKARIPVIRQPKIGVTSLLSTFQPPPVLQPPPSLYLDPSTPKTASPQPRL